MNTLISHLEVIDSLVLLRERLYLECIPPALLTKILQANPWYTPYYISRSLAGIRKWLVAETLGKFCAKYPLSRGKPVRVGLITAGNLPLVGFHDILMGVLSGHFLYIKASHQDRLLLEWVMEQWFLQLPALVHQVRLTPALPPVDYLIATGSNNTARYLDYQFRETPRLIRQNRYSVGIVTTETTHAELGALAEDVLLYNGLGCRNVSTLFLQKGFSLTTWKDVLKSYAKERINPYYLEQLLYERVRMKMLKAAYIDGGVLLMQWEDQLKQAPMGVLNLIEVGEKQVIDDCIDANSQQIQCVVGRDLSFGMTQSPDIHDFADGVDLLGILTSLQLSC